MAVRVGINGFGNIGRRFFRHILDDPRGIEVVAINDITDVGTTAHLLQHDSSYGRLPVDVRAEDGFLVIGPHRVKVYSERDPGAIPWKEEGVDIVIESTGLFTDGQKAAAHIDRGGAKRVIISAPAKHEDATLVMGVNHTDYDPEIHRVISNASCTTNCLAVVSKALDDAFFIQRAMCSTVHSYTNDQRLLDLPHGDLRRARAAALNIIPTSSGASRAVEKALPHLKGKMNAFAMRVPTPAVSVVDLVAQLAHDVTIDQVNTAMQKAALGYMDGYLAVTSEPLVSMDFKGDPHSAIVDLSLTQVVDGSLCKVIAWYDNEWGYSARLVDLVAYMDECGV